MKKLKELTDAKIESGRQANPEFMNGVDDIIKQAKAFEQGSNAIKVEQKAPNFELPGQFKYLVAAKFLLLWRDLIFEFGGSCSRPNRVREDMEVMIGCLSQKGHELFMVGLSFTRKSNHDV